MKKILYILLFVPLLLLAQNENPCYSINDFITQQNNANPPISYQLSVGWNMVGYTGSSENSGIVNQINTALSNDATVENTFQVIKNVSGQFWSSAFAQISDFTQGEGYMMYVISETAPSLSFNSAINIPEIIGCTDCTALNFNIWATLNDESCNYDSDGDGVPDSEEVVGCQDEGACDYDITATDSGECFYAQDGYDCEGSITAEIGDIIEGGYLFYLDESGTRGLVAAQEDMNGTFDWGCLNQTVDNANGMTIGTGYQNTLDIINFGCTSEYSGLIAAQACIDYQYEGYNDWFLPSIDELLQMYNSIGNGGSGNIGSFENSAYWSSTESNNNALVADINFNNGYSSHSWKNSTMNVRPIRAIGNWIEGCTDESACNYNSEVNLPNSTLCEYPEQSYDCDGNITEYVIGMEAEGGIVFYVDETGEHGLVAALEDLGHYEWGSIGVVIDGAIGTSIGTGYQNTIAIVNQGCIPQNNGKIAAQAALDYETSIYDDWYLPSKDELFEIYNTIGEMLVQGDMDCIGSCTWYWSSSQLNSESVWVRKMDSGGSTLGYGDEEFKVHPIRSF